MATVRHATMVLLLSALGCGSLVDDHFVGERRLEFASSLTGDPAPFISIQDKLRLSLFYLQGPANPASVDDLVEHEATRISIRPPASVTWPIFDAPEARHVLTTPSGKRYALGVPLAYVDTNGDGRRNSGESLIGEAPVTAVMFVETALDANESPTGAALEPGFFALSRPLWCAPRPAEPASTSLDCGVRLGEACTVDADCGGPGSCLTSNPWPWPNGTCALRSAVGCVPERAHLWRNHREPSSTYWMKACETDAECRQPYQCDRGYKVCLPGGNLGLRLDPRWMMLPVCQPRMP